MIHRAWSSEEEWKVISGAILFSMKTMNISGGKIILFFGGYEKDERSWNSEEIENWINFGRKIQMAMMNDV